MSEKRIAWLTIVVLLFSLVYIYDNASVGGNDSFINKKIWEPMHEANQYVSLGFVATILILLVYHFVVVFKKKPPKQTTTPVDPLATDLLAGTGL